MTTEPKAEGVVTIGCDDPQCGCKEPAFTEPMEALRFLSGRMKFAGIGEAVAKSYARDIDAILARHQTPTPSAVEALARAAVLLRDEFAGLPHSLGYDFTHLPKIDAALAHPEIAALLKEQTP